MNRVIIQTHLHRERRFHLLRLISTFKRSESRILFHPSVTWTQTPNYVSSSKNVRKSHSYHLDNEGEKASVKLPKTKSAIANTRKKKNATQSNVAEVTAFKHDEATVKLLTSKDLHALLGTLSIKQLKVQDNQKNSNVDERPLIALPTNCSSPTFHAEKLVESFNSFLQTQQTTEVASDKHNNAVVPMTESKVSHSEEVRFLNEQQEKLALANANVKAYLNACVSIGMLNRGQTALQNLRRLNAQISNNLRIKDIEPYLILMSGFAAKGKWLKLIEICKLLHEDNVAFTPQVYANICECHSRCSETEDENTTFQFYLQKAFKEGISLNDIMDKSTFARDQRELVLKALQRIQPDFVPVYTPPIIKYVNPLLEHLNEHVQPIEETFEESAKSTHGCEISNSKQGIDIEEIRRFTKEQLEIENQGVIVVKNVSTTKEPSEKVLFYRKTLDNLLKQWHKQIRITFEHNVKLAQHKMLLRKSGRVDIFPYLLSLKSDEYANILIDELKRLGEGSETYTQTVISLYGRLGEQVLQRYQRQMREIDGITAKNMQLYDKYCEILCSNQCSDNARQLWQRLNHQLRAIGPSAEYNDIEWPWPVLCGIGKFLFQILLHGIKIDVNIFNKKSSVSYAPVLYTLFRNRNCVSREEIRPHPIFIQLYRGSEPENLTFTANTVPMMCPPKPWITPNNGGYLMTKADLIRLPNESPEQMALIKQSDLAEFYPPLDALNQLGCIPWRINTYILDLVVKLFNSGGSAKFKVPLKVPTDMSEAKNSETHLRAQEIANMYSLWCDALYKISLANHFRDRIFWLPHNMDFRGRVYPVPPHLNHLSADMSRALLQFYQKQPLGEDGLRLLKLHCINLTGLKKRDSVQERVKFADQVMDDILDSADKPLDGRLWWLQSDEPWQTLACCIDIANAIRSPDPSKYMSSLPIHQDGSCNGLQHYSALGRDKAGAVSVNLTPCDVPQDVYSTVANLVEKARKKDAEDGVLIAQALENHVKRKIVKQTVMTTVYGVTRYGATLQIEKQLKNIEFRKDLLNRASTYLTQKTFGSLGEMFASATEIQNWLTDCAQFISKIKHRHVEWITPLGLPIVQPYQNEKRFSTVNVENIQKSKVGSVLSLNSRKERNAFPPNFIHSLDACHMMLTSLNCERAGITFVSVHDCFWTHACSVPVMSKICREQFVLLHSQPILEDLSQYFINRYGIKSKEAIQNQGPKKGNLLEQSLLSQVPAKGKFDIKEVLQSTYFFS